MPAERTAGLIVIGNEILSGKVTDTNSGFLARELRAIGVTLRRIMVVPDELDEIAEAVRACRALYDVVFTSGGVGPTHDDVTIAGVALGLDRPVVRHPVLERQLKEHFGAEVEEAHLKMAETVEGTELIPGGNLAFPTLLVQNVVILPGIPEFFREKLAAVKDRFAVDPFFLRVVYTREPESRIAVFLNRTLAEFPELLLGSYPKLNDPEYRVRITLESKDQAYLDAAFAALVNMLPPRAVVRTE